MPIMITAPQRRLLFYLSIGFFAFTLVLHISRTSPIILEALNTDQKPADEGIKVTIGRADRAMSYGKYARPIYDDIHLIGNLPHEHIPTLQNKRRLIVIGDIHGMLGPLNDLLKKVRFNPETDHIVSLGDMVNKGPNSAGTVARLMELKASAVRGNHEDRVILAWASLNSQFGVEAYLNTEDTALHRGNDQDIDTARTLNHVQMDWLKSLPVILSAEPMSLYMVHAGLAPGVPAQRQDPWTVMNMRTLRFPREEYRKSETERLWKLAEKKKLEEEKKKLEEEKKELGDGTKKQEGRLARLNKLKKREEEEERLRAQLKVAHKQAQNTAEDAASPSKRLAARAEPSSTGTLSDLPPNFDHDIWIPVASNEGERWTDVWNSVQRQLPALDRRFVIYGHDAKRGFHEDAYTFGLDSSCVKGNTLTALVIEANAEGGWAHEAVQVNCPKPNHRFR